MIKLYAFLAAGLEEVECLAAMDVLVRGGIDVTLVSMEEGLEVTGTHNFTLKAHKLFKEIDCQAADVLYLPGGPGTVNLDKHSGLCEELVKAANTGKRLAAICAAPSILGRLNLLNGKKAVCYPGYEDKLLGADCVFDGVITDGNITTARGLGYSLDIGLELLKVLLGKEIADKVKYAIQYDQVESK